jgi:serine phosphatase RsbU (regulator of sigma subunit)
MDIVLADVMGHGAPAALVAADGEGFGICGC